MLRRKFGWTRVDVPVIGQGTWIMEASGGSSSSNKRENGDAERRAVQALQMGLDLGMTHIDTAEMYGSGRVERLVGQAIAGRRDEVFLVSKVLPENASYEGTIKACRRSLERLGTDRLDLYLLHWPGSHPIGETMRAMEKLVAEGRARFIGVSNFDVEQLKEAESALSSERLACNQVLYHLGYREIERRLLPYCAERGIAIVGYSPFGHGNFPSHNRVLLEVGRRHGGKTPRQVALNFLTRHPALFTIPKASNPEHVRENSGGGDGWELDKKDVEAIDRAFPLPPGSGGNGLEMI
jgi:diketogulonate reductase-like aldo/keto reductase